MDEPSRVQAGSRSQAMPLVMRTHLPPGDCCAKRSPSTETARRPSGAYAGPRAPWRMVVSAAAAAWMGGASGRACCSRKATATIRCMLASSEG